eukprot:COSAG02_NODE_23200_length_726_cov_31.730463_1_plen_142_part_01
MARLRSDTVQSGLEIEAQRQRIGVRALLLHIDGGGEQAHRSLKQRAPSPAFSSRKVSQFSNFNLGTCIRRPDCCCGALLAGLCGAAAGAGARAAHVRRVSCTYISYRGGARTTSSSMSAKRQKLVGELNAALGADGVVFVEE